VELEDEPERRMNKRANTTAPAAASAPTTASTPATSDPMEKLKKLGELHDAGILTEEEFSAKKADTLSKI